MLGSGEERDEEEGVMGPTLELESKLANDSGVAERTDEDSDGEDRRVTFRVARGETRG